MVGIMVYGTVGINLLCVGKRNGSVISKSYTASNPLQNSFLYHNKPYHSKPFNTRNFCNEFVVSIFYQYSEKCIPFRCFITIILYYSIKYGDAQ